MWKLYIKDFYTMEKCKTCEFRRATCLTAGFVLHTLSNVNSGQQLCIKLMQVQIQITAALLRNSYTDGKMSREQIKIYSSQKIGF